MARRVFFSFHYERDIWRAGQVRNSWVTKPDRDDAGFWDAASWEKIQKEEDEVIKRWINRQLDGTSVTVVLIGKETSNRKWVKYEIQESYRRGNGLLGIYIHKIEDSLGNTDAAGDSYFGEIGLDTNGEKVYFSVLYPTYDWVDGNGYKNLGDWVETAAKKAGK